MGWQDQRDLAANRGVYLAAAIQGQELWKNHESKRHHAPYPAVISFGEYLVPALSLHIATRNTPLLSNKSSKYFGDGLTFDDVLELIFAQGEA